jgi:hypothetical protein
LFLLAARGLGFGVMFVNLTWPLYIIVPGVGLLAFAGTDRDISKGLAPIGMMVTLTGCLLAYQEWANHYQSWAYMWILVGPFALGAGWIAHGMMHDDNRTIADGRKLAAASIATLIVFAAVFELVFNISGYGLSVNLPSGMLLPLLFIAISGAVLFRQVKPRGSRLQQNHDAQSKEDVSNDL